MEEVRKLVKEALEGVMKEQRYVAEVDFFIWANSDEDARTQAQAIAAELDSKYDNRAAIKSLGLKPSGLGNFSSINISDK